MIYVVKLKPVYTHTGVFTYFAWLKGSAVTFTCGCVQAVFD